MTQVELEVDDLLFEWWTWTRSYRMPIGYPSSSVYCKEAMSSRQWETTEELAFEAERQSVLLAIQWCVDSLPGRYQTAIGMEMRNRQLSRQVWRSDVPYSEVLAVLLPKMRQRGLV